jgi:sn-glycerol 3-phosphate transport system ATP-binding protein
MAQVSLRDLRKSYAGAEVIHGVSCEIADGELVVIVGPSGCGKSTLLRMVAGLEEISAGEVAIGGRVVNAVEPKDRDIAMVFQNYALYPHMTVFGNMAYGLKIRGLSKATSRHGVGRAADILQSTSCSTAKPRAARADSVSASPWARPSCARGLPVRRTIVESRRQLRVIASGDQKLQQALATTSIYVTHDRVRR